MFPNDNDEMPILDYHYRVESNMDLFAPHSLGDLIDSDQLTNLFYGQEPGESGKKFNPEIKIQTENKQTAITSLVKKEEDVISISFENNIFQENNLLEDNFIEPEKKEPKKLLGRKTKNDTEEREHTKFKEDNIMRKIKSHFFKFIPDYVNSSLPPEHKKFLKIDKGVNQELKRDFNVELMKKTIGDIFTENTICGRYSETKNGENYNAELVEEIYRNNEELEAIEKLKQTYTQVLDYFRKNHLKKFQDEIYNKQIRSGETESIAKRYTNLLISLLANYESWFTDKSPRGPKKSLLKNKKL
jgi:hypothetical protein